MKLFKTLFVVAAAVLVFNSCAEKKPQYANRAEMIVAQIHDPNSKYVVVASHRGDWRNWPENSIPAIESLIQMGGDMMELDIALTKDSVLVLSHDATVNRCTNGRGAIRDLTFDEIRQLRLKRAHGVTTDTLRMPTLREALEVCKDRITVNVDHGYEYYDMVLEITEELGVTDQVLIKGSRAIDVVAAHEAKYDHNMMYMPIVNIQQEKGQALFNSYLDTNTVPLAYEVCFGSYDDGVFDETCKKILDQGSKIWVNTIWASLCGGLGHDDDAAFATGDFEGVYKSLLDKGVSMIQTDRPEMLVKYLESIGRH